MRIKRSIALVLCLFLQAALAGAASGRATYQFRGKLLISNDTALDGLKVHVILQGISTPFITRTLADLAGCFKFNNLQSGTYILVASHDHLGELRKTVEIGPSFADAAGRISAMLKWDPKPIEQNLFTISSVALSVPDHARRLYLAALDLLGKYDVKAAINRLEEAVQTAPQFSAAWSYLGSIAYQSHQYARAETYFREAFRLEPTSGLTLINMGGVLLSEDKFDEALPFNQQAVEAAPNNALARSQLGLNYFRLGNESAAEIQLREAKKSDPAHFSYPQLILSRICKDRKDYSCMIGELEEFLRLHPDSSLADAVRVSLATERQAIASEPQRPQGPLR